MQIRTYQSCEATLFQERVYILFLIGSSNFLSVAFNGAIIYFSTLMHPSGKVTNMTDFVIANGEVQRRLKLFNQEVSTRPNLSRQSLLGLFIHTITEQLLALK